MFSGAISRTNPTVPSSSSASTFGFPSPGSPITSVLPVTIIATYGASVATLSPSLAVSMLLVISIVDPVMIFPICPQSVSTRVA